MTELQKIKISVSILIATGVVKSQQDLADRMGYKTKSSFSQIVNGVVRIPADFVVKLKSLDNNVNLFWENEFNYETKIDTDMKNREIELEMLRQRIKDLEEKLEMCKELRQKDRQLLDKSL